MAPLISKIVSGIGFARSKGKILASGGSIKIFENYTYHVFTSPTIFNLTGAISQIEYLIIGGGGGTGYNSFFYAGGGGGEHWVFKWIPDLNCSLCKQCFSSW